MNPFRAFQARHPYLWVTVAWVLAIAGGLLLSVQDRGWRWGLLIPVGAFVIMWGVAVVNIRKNTIGPAAQTVIRDTEQDPS